MRHPGEDRQDHLRHLQPGQPGRPHCHPHLGHLGPHLVKPHTEHRSLDCRAEMGSHGKMFRQYSDDRNIIFRKLSKAGK